MSEQEILLSLLLGLCALCVGVLVVTIMQWRHSIESLGDTRALRVMRGRLPSVVVIMYVRRVTDDIDGTLRSVFANRYKKLTVVVVDDSHDHRVAQKLLVLQHDLRRMQILTRRASSTRTAAIKAGYAKAGRADIVIAAEAGVKLDPDTIRVAAARLGVGSEWTFTPRDHSEVHDLVMLGRALEAVYWRRPAPVTAYSHKAFVRLNSSDRYDFDVEPAFMTVHIVLLVVLVGSALLAFGPQLVWYAWVMVVAYGVALSLGKVEAAMQEKMLLLCSLPVALFLIPATSFVRGISQYNFRK